ncbi:MAG: hypothetical protein C4291_07010 [Candidatus Dadabacteria bacterium]
MPSLREMREDIPVLAKHFLNSFGNEIGKGLMSFSPDAMGCLVRYSWPGNVRSGGNKQKASRILGLTRQGLIKKIKRYKLY